MRLATVRLLLLAPLLALLLAPRLVHRQGATAAEKEAIEEARTAVAEAEKRVETLEIEMVKAYAQVEADLEKTKEARRRSKLIDMVRAAVDAAPPGKGRQRAVSDYLFDSLWTTSDLLSPPVARLFALSAADHAIRLRKPPARASEAALTDIFPDRPMDEIWDVTFTDIPIVRRWQKACVDRELARIDLMRCEKGGVLEVDSPPGMVLVPEGKFLFGPHSGYPRQDTVREGKPEDLSGFFIHRHEVTNGQYREFLDAQPEKSRPALTPAGWTGVPPTFPTGRRRHPVTEVTLEQAQAFARHHGWRLPTELEWEKAARGYDFRWPWGNEFHADHLIWGGDRATGTAQVLSRPRDLSPWFVSGMAGNVSELTTTLKEGKPFKGRPRPTDQIVIRGGSFGTKDPARAATTLRWVLTATEKLPEIGFRCVVDETDWRRRKR